MQPKNAVNYLLLLAVSSVWYPTFAVGQTVDAGRGPVSVIVPDSYDPEVPMPLIMLLHGYCNDSAIVEGDWQLSSLANDRGFLLVIPDGFSDFFGCQYWNATNACCDQFNASPDDSGYLRDLLEEVEASFNVDPARIYSAGFSNGGFMSYRLACDHADKIAAIAVLSGAMHNNPNDCMPSEPVAVIHFHGTSDGVIAYNGGLLPGGSYPSAIESIEDWASLNGCNTSPSFPPELLDLNASVPGAESESRRYDNCHPGGHAELWTMNSGTHSDDVTNTFRNLVVDFLLSQGKPAPSVPTVSSWGYAVMLLVLVTIGSLLLHKAPPRSRVA